MRKILVFFIVTLLILASCKSKHIDLNKNLYKISKIKTLKKYYIIYATKNDTIFKIVSGKTTKTDCREKIKVNNSYDLKLESLSSKAPIINGVKIYSADIDCFVFDEDTSICIERDKNIYELYFPTNLNGLCID